MFQNSLFNKLVMATFVIGFGLSFSACEKKEEAAAPTEMAPPPAADAAPPMDAHPPMDAPPPASN